MVEMKFREFFLEQNTVGKHNDFATSAFLPSDFTGSEWPDIKLPFLSSIDLKIPQTTTKSEIKEIKFNQNPIEITLKNGTKIFLNIDQYLRIYPKPEVGKNMIVTFQRSPDDSSKTISKIDKIYIN
jgi:hypothetical protein